MPNMRDARAPRCMHKPSRGQTKHVPPDGTCMHTITAIQHPIATFAPQAPHASCAEDRRCNARAAAIQLYHCAAAAPPHAVASPGASLLL